MAHALRGKFGEMPCELGVERSSESGFVAWALQVKPDGSLVPLYDKRGALLLFRGRTPERTLANLRARVTEVFGAERELTQIPANTTSI